MKSKPITLHFQRYLLTGVLTAIPLWITWWVFDLFFQQLSNIGMPWARAMAKTAEGYFPLLAQWLNHPVFLSLLAVIATLIALYLLGWMATRVIGKRLLTLFDRVIQRIPIAQTIYGSAKKLITALQQKPESIRRVVLIEFPSPDMKTIGFVTRVMKDRQTGRELAAVYVPTTPNPTSGYMEIVPLDKLVSTDWSMDEAMSFIISGGAIAPEDIDYNGPGK